MAQPTLSHRWRIKLPLAAGLALAGVRPVLAQDVTPTTAAGPLPELLARVPLPATDEPELATFADVSAQVAALGVTRPASVADEAHQGDWIRAVLPLAVADPFLSFQQVFTRDLIGFDATDIEQTLMVGRPPYVVTLVRGRFDADAVASAWASSGYHPIEAGGVPAASLAEALEFDLDNPIQHYALSRLNNAAILAGDTLAYAPTAELLRATVTAAAGSGSALGQRVDVATLVGSLPAPLASGILFSGRVLSAEYQHAVPPAVATEAAGSFNLPVLQDGTMPPVALGLIGMTPGGPAFFPGDATPVPQPAGAIVIHLLLAEPDTAEQARATIAARFPKYRSARSDRRLADFFAGFSVRAMPEQNVVTMELTPGGDTPIRIWWQLYTQLDLVFLAW